MISSHTTCKPPCWTMTSTSHLVTSDENVSIRLFRSDNLRVEVSLVASAFDIFGTENFVGFCTFSGWLTKEMFFDKDGMHFFLFSWMFYTSRRPQEFKLLFFLMSWVFREFNRNSIICHMKVTGALSTGTIKFPELIFLLRRLHNYHPNWI